MSNKRKLIYVPYDEARKHILDGDVLLYRGRGLLAWAIRHMGRSEYHHVAMAGWTNGGAKDPKSRLMAHEMRYTGGQMNLLSSHMRKHAGHVDVYRAADTFTRMRWVPCEVNGAVGMPVIEHHCFDRKGAVITMRDLCQQGAYGFPQFCMLLMLHTPFLRFFLNPVIDDEYPCGYAPAICSEGVAVALRKNFTDVVNNMSDQYTEPADLARSPLLNYMFTLAAPTIPLEALQARAATSAKHSKISKMSTSELVGKIVADAAMIVDTKSKSNDEPQRDSK